MADNNEEVVETTATTETKTIPYVDLNGKVENKVETPAGETKVETPEIEKTEKTPETTERKYWDDEYKNVFGDEDIDTVKSYKTKATEYETKLKELEANKVEFANEKIKHLNELAKNGIEIDENTVAFLNKDYNKIDNPLSGLAEALRNEHPDWSDKKIQFELKSKYKLDQIVPDDDGELTEAQKEIKEIVDEDIARDWNSAKKSLIEKQEKIRFVKPKEQSAEEIAKAEAKKAEDAKVWQETVKKVSNQNNSLKFEFAKDLGIKINDAPVEIAPIDYEVSKEDKAVIDKLFANPNDLWKHITEGAKNDDESLSRIYQFIALGLTGKKAMEKAVVNQFKNAYEMSVKSDKKVSDVKDGRGMPDKTGQAGKLPYVPVR